MIIDPKRVAIIGMGPAGVSAAIYLKRYGMEPVCFEKELIGGKVNKTEKIENYPGLPSLKGPDFALQYESQLSFFNIEVNYEEVTSVTLTEDGFFLVKTDFSEEVPDELKDMADELTKFDAEHGSDSWSSGITIEEFI